MREGESAERTIHDVVRAEPEYYYCQGIGTLSGTIRCSRITVAKDLVRDNIRTERLGWVESPDYVPDAHIATLERGLAGLTKNNLPHERPFAWVTKTESVDIVRRRTAKAALANVLREKLGLLHYSGEYQFIELCYPEDICSMTSLSPPTFLDGSPYIVYRSNKGPGGWGITVDLINGDDGFPEAVHKPLPLSQHFRVRNIGWVNRIHQDFQFESIYGGATHRWTTDCMNEFMDYLR